MITTGMYRHYKGGIYEVMAVGAMEATKQSVVIYRSVADMTWWVRSLVDFVSDVTIDQLQKHDLVKVTVPRFVKV